MEWLWFALFMVVFIKGTIDGWKRKVVWEYVRSQPPRPSAQRPVVVRRPQPTRSTASGPGFVYLVKSGDFYKIGLAVDVEDRVRSLRTNSPYPAEVLHTVKTPSMRRLELLLHKAYRHKRTQGEWFALEPDDVATICAIPSAIGERELILLEMQP